MQTKAEIEAIWSKDSEIEAIMDKDKVVRANIRWQRTIGGSFRFEVGVLVPSSGFMLKLTGFRGKRNHSFTLLYQNRPVRMYTYHNYAPHPNPDGQKITQPHKHVWDKLYHEKLAYVPEDFSSADINAGLKIFLGECNIRLTGALEAFLL